MAYVIRPSSLASWLDCPRRTAARLFPNFAADLGVKLRTVSRHVGAAVGTSIHAGVGYSMAHKIVDGTLGHQDEREQRALDALREQVETEGITFDEMTDNLNTAERQILRMTEAYIRHVAPQVDPVEVERRMEADVGDGFVLSGQIDQRTTVTPDYQAIRDLKTGRHRANHVQYGAYYKTWQAYGYPVVAIYEDFIPRVSLRREQPKPTIYKLDVAMCNDEATEAIDDVKRGVLEYARRRQGEIAKAPELAFRANPASMFCSAKFCPAFGTDFCRAHRHTIINEGD